MADAKKCFCQCLWALIWLTVSWPISQISGMYYICLNAFHPCRDCIQSCVECTGEASKGVVDGKDVRQAACCAKLGLCGGDCCKKNLLRFVWLIFWFFAWPIAGICLLLYCFTNAFSRCFSCLRSPLEFCWKGVDLTGRAAEGVVKGSDLC
eukprot:TRINITY_DN17451_c0_g1_i1.p1 TRINITY_DN17451_c0_g1~~TRINITY_DN17451_c0_g1_i1.p1  ORF type:complete len:151 (+),score=46.00 TRINITY_DN17451_c0_g1_i1:58-510(+)